MTELINALYNFLQDHYLSGISQDPDYEKAIGYAETRQELLSRQLNDSQRQLLTGMLAELRLAHTMEQMRLFRATLALSRELSGLVQP